jgi:hypothetical protein
LIYTGNNFLPLEKLSYPLHQPAIPLLNRAKDDKRSSALYNKKKKSGREKVKVFSNQFQLCDKDRKVFYNH